MNRPCLQGYCDDRFLECYESMEDHFNDIMDAASPQIGRPLKPRPPSSILLTTAC